MKTALRSSSLRRRRYEEEINPLDGVVNIVDAMLVFACGLMLSLVIYWNVDIQGSSATQIEQGNAVTQLKQGEDVTEVEQIRENIEKDQKGGDSYEKLGTVYKDPETGKMYLLEE